MEYSNCNLIVKIIHLLQQKRDGLVLIDGKWGTGKTFFIRNILPRYYDIKVFYYISLLGIKSLTDFKAKIIDCYYLKDIATLKSGLESIAGIGSISSGSPASANVINNMFNSIGASVRENILSKLNGVFILDDIERLANQELANEILTYCHTLYLQNTSSNLDFIVVSNSSNESSLKLDHKEKIISDTAHYNPSPNEILDMNLILDKLTHFPLEDRNVFREITINNNIVNIRVLMRAINAATPLYLYAKLHPELSWKIPSSIVLNSMYSFFILHLLHDKPLHELLNDRKPIISDDDEKSKTHERKLWSSLNNYNINEDLKKYFSGHISSNDVIDTLFFEPKPLSLIDIATAVRPEVFDVDEKDLHETLISLVSKQTPCDLHCWLRSVQNYEYLTTHKYLPKSPLVNLQLFTSVSMKFSDNEIIECFEKHGYNQHSNMSHTIFDDSRLIFIILSFRYENIIKERNLLNIKYMLELNGWAKFDVNLLNKVHPHGNYAPLSALGAPFITRCILKVWKVKDIEMFCAFLRSNFRISNISQFAGGEKSKLIYLNQKLEIFCLSNKEGFKFGAIYDLNNAIKHAITLL